VAEDAVWCEPFSGPAFPANREKSGISVILAGPEGEIVAVNNWPSESYALSCEFEAGIRQGIFAGLLGSF
jgi:hypothetical protein